LLHYSAIPEQQRRTGAWNNLGVALSELNFASTAVLAYKKASDHGETIAAGNLANKLITAGFLAEAEAICEEALRQKYCSHNVAEALAKAKKELDAEKERYDLVIKNAEPLKKFFANFGHAATQVTPKAVSSWKSGEPDFVLKGTIEAGQFSATGVYETRDNFGSLLMFTHLNPLSTSDQPEPSPRKNEIQIKGFVRGKAIKATITRKCDPPRTLLGDADSNTEALMIFSEDGSELSVCEFKAGAPAFYRLIHVAE
jgi:hypothetical protein